MHNISITDPRTLLVSNATILHAANELKEYKAFIANPQNKGKKFKTYTDEELWYFRKLRDGSVHPDSGDVIYRPFRMSGYVPYGTPLVLFMLVPAAANNPYIQAVAQVLNQTHNACVNWSNRSIVEGSNAEYDIARGYIAAVTAAVTVSSTTNFLLNKVRCSDKTRGLLRMFIPFPAVAVSSTTNMAMMRFSELQRGIAVYNADTEEKLGTSKAAAKSAIFSTAQSRVALVFCAVAAPQILYTSTEALGVFAKFPRSKLPLQALYTIACFGVGVPLSLSLFTQDVFTTPSALEPEIQAAAKAANCNRIRFNKGL